MFSGTVWSIWQWSFAISHSVLGRQGCCSGQSPYRTTPLREQHISIPCFPIECRSSMDCTWVSRVSRNMSQNWFHILHDILDYRKLAVHLYTPWNFWGATMALHRPRWTSTKGKVTTFLDKTGLAHTNQTLKRQSNEWKHLGSSRPKKVRPTQCAVKVMFIVAYAIDGVILHHTVPPRQTVNVAYYCTFLQLHFRPVLWRKWRHLVVQNPVILHDNARSHTAAAVTDLLRRWQCEILQYPPYSPDMSPCKYDLFAKVKEPLWGTRYNTRDKLIHATGWSIWNINKDRRADGVLRLPNFW